MMWYDFFRDPVLRAPTIGSMLMCFAAALVGVVVFVRKRSLLGESLSHAAYPGVTGAILLAGALSLQATFPLLVLVGAGFSALLGYFLIEFLERRLRFSDDAALCFVLALFFGIGITLASYAQNIYPNLFRQIQAYLYGQAATMTDGHIVLYALLTLIVVLALYLFHKEILALSFDRTFAKASGMASKAIEALFTLLMVVAIVIGIRSVGVILMSAMLVAPAAAARQFTNRLVHMFLLAGLFGLSSGYFGTYLSVAIPGMPTGPLIVLVAGGFAFYALLFAPERGLFMRYMRVARFRTLQMKENLLKSLWHAGEPLTFSQISERQSYHKWRLFTLLVRLRLRGWLAKKEAHYHLTESGVKRGAQIVRLHRLWELYLVDALGMGHDRVHTSAEEMEHILTPELERRLTQLLDDPKHDPHAQPIPTLEEAHG